MKAQTLKSALQQLGISQVEFAFILGVTDRTVRFWVAGSYPVPPYASILVQTWKAFPDSVDLAREIIDREWYR